MKPANGLREGEAQAKPCRLLERLLAFGFFFEDAALARGQGRETGLGDLTQDVFHRLLVLLLLFSFFQGFDRSAARTPLRKQSGFSRARLCGLQ